MEHFDGCIYEKKLETTYQITILVSPHTQALSVVPPQWCWNLMMKKHQYQHFSQYKRPQIEWDSHFMTFDWESSTIYQLVKTLFRVWEVFPFRILWCMCLILFKGSPSRDWPGRLRNCFSLSPNRLSVNFGFNMQFHNSIALFTRPVPW